MTDLTRRSFLGIMGAATAAVALPAIAFSEVAPDPDVGVLSDFPDEQMLEVFLVDEWVPIGLVTQWAVEKIHPAHACIAAAIEVGGNFLASKLFQPVGVASKTKSDQSAFVGAERSCDLPALTGRADVAMIDMIDMRVNALACEVWRTLIGIHPKNLTVQNKFRIAMDGRLHQFDGIVSDLCMTSVSSGFSEINASIKVLDPASAEEI